MFISIAEIIGKGRYLKNQLNNIAEIKSVIIAIKNAEVLCVAQLFIFKAVLIKTAVAGSHHIIPLQIFETANHKTSLSLSNFTLVIFSAILADIIVSSMAMIEITSEVVNNKLKMSANCLKSTIWILNGFLNNVKVRSVYLSDNNKILGKCSFAIIHKPIQTIVRIITPGNPGLYFFKTNKNHNQKENNKNEYKSVLVIFANISYRFI